MVVVEEGDVEGEGVVDTAIEVIAVATFLLQ